MRSYRNQLQTEETRGLFFSLSQTMYWQWQHQIQTGKMHEINTNVVIQWKVAQMEFHLNQ